MPPSAGLEQKAFIYEVSGLLGLGRGAKRPTFHFWAPWATENHKSWLNSFVEIPLSFLLASAVPFKWGWSNRNRRKPTLWPRPKWGPSAASERSADRSGWIEGCGHSELLARFSLCLMDSPFKTYPPPINLDDRKLDHVLFKGPGPCQVPYCW